MRCRIGRIAVSVRDHRNGFNQVSYRPTRLFSLDREAVLARGPAPDQVERDALDQCHVARTIIRAQALVVVAEDDIQNPMDRIFNRPMTPDGFQELVRRQGPRGDVVAGERRDLAAPHDRALHGGDRLEPRPGRFAAEPGRGRRHRAAAGLLTPVRGLRALAALHRLRCRPLERRLDPGQQLGLVGLDRQQVVGSGLDDPLGDRPIAAGRVDRHQRALEAQLVEQRGDHDALVRLAVHDLLGQDEALLARIGRQGVQRALAGAGVAGPLRGLAVDRDQASGRIAPIQASKHSSKVPGSSALTTSLSVSWLGTPRANGRIERKDARFRPAQPAISTMLSAPAKQPASAISRISSSRYNTLPRCRGSSTVVKKSRTVPEALSMTPPAKDRAIAYEKSGRWFTAEEPFLRAKERTDAGSSAFRHPRFELIAPLPQEVEPAFNNRKLHMRLPWMPTRAHLPFYCHAAAC